MLSAVPPTVEAVHVSSTEWTTDFTNYLQSNNLGSGGFAIPAGTSAQSTSLPWFNINQIKLTFSEDVDINMTHLSVSGVNKVYEFAAFSYDDQTFTATWTLTAPFANDRVMLDLDGDGLAPVADLDGNALDGEWVNNTSTFSSGNGAAGGDFEFRFNVLPGDYNGSNGVTNSDYAPVAMSYGTDTTMAGYSHRKDLDGDGLILDDHALLYPKIGTMLPAGSPIGASSDAPSTTGVSNVAVNEDAVDEVISLWDYFDDVEDLGSGLTYQVKQNSNEDLFNSVNLNSSTGQLTLDFADHAFGSAEFVIRATDSSGLFVETTITVNAAPVNDAPVISNFWGEYQGAGTWLFTGNVTDVDDDVVGFVVTFDGFLSGHTAEVESDGIFYLVAILSPTTWGEAGAQTTDPHGADSNFANFFMMVT